MKKILMEIEVHLVMLEELFIEFDYLQEVKKMNGGSNPFIEEETSKKLKDVEDKINMITNDLKILEKKVG